MIPQLYFLIASYSLPAWLLPFPVVGMGSATAVTSLPLADLTEGELGKAVLGLVCFSSLVAAVLGIISYFRPQPALHKQFADKEDHDKAIEGIEATLKEMRKDFESWSSDHYKGRRRMHRKINHISSALSYLAGTIEHREPKTAERLREMIEAADSHEGEDE